MSRTNLARSIQLGNHGDTCELVAQLLRNLSHPGRLQVLGHLVQGPKTVSELQALCDISQSQLSQFLSRMRLEGLIDCERMGKYQQYKMTDKKLVKLIHSIHSIYCE